LFSLVSGSFFGEKITRFQVKGRLGCEYRGKGRRTSGSRGTLLSVGKRDKELVLEGLFLRGDLTGVFG